MIQPEEGSELVSEAGDSGIAREVWRNRQSFGPRRPAIS